jgi:hypothetical protein
VLNTLLPRSVHDITAAGATPHILSLEASTVADLTSLFQSVQPNAIIFSAGAGGKGGPERTKAVDYEGALKVFDAMEAGNFHRILMVSATDLRGEGFAFAVAGRGRETCAYCETRNGRGRSIQGASVVLQRRVQ